jgi:hypothetical protein
VVENDIGRTCAKKTRAAFNRGLILRFYQEIPCVSGELGKGSGSLYGMKISDISWDMVRMVSINDLNLRVTTDIGVLSYDFDTTEELSEALLILSLTGTKKVEFIDEARFNPARFLSNYKGQRKARTAAAR